MKENQLENSELYEKRSYFITVDILKGLAIFPMIFGHSIGWWDSQLPRNYETGSLLLGFIIITGVMVFPCFLFFAGFNQVNSLLKKGLIPSNRRQIRSRTIKRSFIFFILAIISMILMSFVRSPDDLGKIVNFFFTWHLFHMFAFSALFILLIFELSCWFSDKNSIKLSIKHFMVLGLFISLLLVILLFVFFHDYTTVHPSSFPVDLDIIKIIENIFLDVSSCGVIPWLSYALAGGLTASYLNLTHFSKKNILKKSFIVFFVNSLLLLVGIIFLTSEKITSAGIGSPSSFSHVFISIGLIGSINILLLLIVDIYQSIPPEVIKKYTHPIIAISKISLTVYLVHPIFAILNPEIIPSETILYMIVALYCLFFVFLAILWKKWDFKFSFEWFISRLS